MTPRRSLPPLVPAALALLLLLSPRAPLGAQQQGAAAQRVELSGRVVDGNTGAPVAQAVVALPALRRQAVTDAEGRFRLDRVPAGEHAVEVKRLGYANLKRFWTAAPGGEPTELRLLPQPMVLERVTVVEDRLERRRRRVPTTVRTIRSEEILLSGTYDAADLVKRHVHVVPCPASFKVDDCVIRRGGQMVGISLTIDERPAFGGLEDLELYDPQDIHLIEVYGRGTAVRAYTNEFMRRLATNPRTLEWMINW